MRIQDQIVTKFTADAKELEQALQRIRELFAQTFTAISERVRSTTNQAAANAKTLEQAYGRAAQQAAQQVTQAFQTINTRAQEAARGVQQTAQQAGRSQQAVAVQVENVSRAMESAGRSTRRAAADFSIFTPTSREAAASLDRLNRMLGQASTSFRRSAGSVLTGIEALDILSIRLDRASMMMWRFTMAVIPLRMLSFYLGGLTAALLGYVYKIATAAGELDQARRAFAAATGSMEEATQTIEYLREQAPKIRYTLSEIIEAARILTVAGYDVRKLLMPMADLAAGINQAGITIADAARAFVDAMHGEFRRLKNTFDITKQDVERFAQGAIDAQGRVVDKAKLQYGILMAIQEKYGGANAAAMAGMAGAWANFSDSLTRFFQAAGKNLVPFFVRILNIASKLIETFEKIAESPFGSALLAWGPLIAGLAAGLGTLITLTTMLVIHLRGLVAMYHAWRRAGTETEMDLIRAHREMMMLEEGQAALQVAAASRALPVRRQQLALMREQIRLARAIQRAELARIGQELPADVARRLGIPARGRQEAARELREAREAVRTAEERLAVLSRIAEYPALRMQALPSLRQMRQQLVELRERREGINRQLETTRSRLDEVRERLNDINLSEEERVALNQEAERLAQSEQQLLQQRAQITGRINRLNQRRALLTQELLQSRRMMVAALRGEYGEEVRLLAIEIMRGREMQRQLGFIAAFRQGLASTIGMFFGAFGAAGGGLRGIGAAIGGFLGQLGGFFVISALISAASAALKWMADTIYKATHKLEIALEKLAKRAERLKDTTVEIPAALEHFLSNTEDAAQRIKAVEQAEARARHYTGPTLAPTYPTVVPLGVAYAHAPAGLRRELMIETIRYAEAHGYRIEGLEELKKKYGGIELIPTKELEKVQVSKEAFKAMKQEYEAYSDQIDKVLTQLENEAAAYDQIAQEQARGIAGSREMQELLKRHGVSWQDIAAAIRLSKHPAGTLARQYEEIEDTIERDLEDLDNLDEKMEKQLDQGKDINEVMAEYYSQLQRAQQNYNDLVTVVRLHNEISERGRKEREKMLEEERKRLDIAWKTYYAFKAQQEAIEAQLAASLILAGGGTTIATGRVLAALQTAQAQYEWAIGKRRDAIKTLTNAVTNLMKAEEQEFNLRRRAISEIEDPVERARQMRMLVEDRMRREQQWYEWRRRAVDLVYMNEEDKARLRAAIDRDHYLQMQAYERERQKWIRQEEIEYRNKIIASLQVARQEAENFGATKADLLLYDIEIARQSYQIALLEGKTTEAGKRLAEIKKLQLEYEREQFNIEQSRIDAHKEFAETWGTSLQLIRQYQLAIYNLRMQEARWLEQHGRHVEALRKRAEARKALNTLADEELNFETQRLNLIKKMHEVGLASEAQVEAARRRAAQVALNLARRYGLDTKEGMQAFMRYLDLAYDKTERATEGIIKKILGAPQELIERIISPAELQRRFGAIEGLIMPLGQPVTANLIQANRGELVIRLKFEDLPKNIDKKIQSAIESGAKAMAREIVSQLTGR